MKRCIITFGCCAALLFSCDCADDSNMDGINVSNLNGKWYYQQLRVNGITTIYDEQECERDIIEFHDSQKYHILDRINCEDNHIESGIYTITTDSLNLTRETGENIRYKIILLNASTIVLDGNHDYNGDGSADRIRLNFNRKI